MSVAPDTRCNLPGRSPKSLNPSLHLDSTWLRSNYCSCLFERQGGQCECMILLKGWWRGGSSLEQKQKQKKRGGGTISESSEALHTLRNVSTPPPQRLRHHQRLASCASRNMKLSLIGAKILRGVGSNKRPLSVCFFIFYFAGCTRA